MSLIYDFWNWLSSLPVVREIVAWALRFPELNVEEKLEAVTHAVVVVLGSGELWKYTRRFLFRRRSRIEMENAHVVLRSTKALLARIDGDPNAGPLVV